MAYPFNTVVQHHEGAGTPSDNVMRFAGGGYSYGIGVNAWTCFREPAGDYSTADYNGRVIGVCLSGDRNVSVVTDRDLQMMGEIASHARSKGWLVDQPGVFAHRQMPFPNQTVCAGYNVGPAVPAKNLTGNDLMWMTIVGKYHKQEVPALPQVLPQYWPTLNVASACVFNHATLGKCTAMVTVAGNVYCEPGGAYMGSPYNDDGSAKAYWKLPDGSLRSAAWITAAPGTGYIVEATTGEKYGPVF